MGEGSGNNHARTTLDSIFRAAPVGIGFVISRYILEVNDRLCEMLGYSREELIGKSARMLYPSDQEYEWVGEEKYAQIRETGKGTVETQWMCKNGAVIDILLSSAAIDPADLSVGVTFTALDITDTKKTERALEESEKMFRLISEQSVLGILLLQDEVIKYVNQAAADILEYTVEEMLSWKPGECFTKVIHPDDFSFVTDQARRKLSGDKHYMIKYTWKAITKSRKVKWVETYSRPVQFGDKLADLVAMIDVTKHKLAEDALRESQKKLKDMAKQ